MERWLGLSVQIATLLTLIVGLWKMFRKQADTHELVNGQSDRLRVAAEQVSFAAGQAAEQANQAAMLAQEAAATVHDVQGKINGTS